MRAHWILLAVVGCGHGAIPAPAPTVASPATVASPGLTFAPWDGVYLPTTIGGEGSGPPASVVRTLTHGVSVVVGPDSLTSTTTAPGGGWKFEKTGDKETYTLTLDPPARDGLPWRIAVDGMKLTFEQRIGALEALVRSRLVVGARYVRLDRNKIGPAGPVDDALTQDSITVMERGLVRMDLAEKSGVCSIDALIPALATGNKALPSPVPAGDALGSVTYTLGKIDEGCKGRSLDAEARGIDGGVRFFADRTGSVAGLLVIAYLYAELYVPPHVSRADLERMGRAAQEEQENQAE